METTVLTGQKSSSESTVEPSDLSATVPTSGSHFAPLMGPGGERGQGILEYILILVVTVGIILGMVHQFSDAFRVYVQNYYGEYISCLLETGELPSLGGDGSVGICNSEFQEFSLDEGRPFIGSGVGSTSTSSSSDSDSSSSSSSSSSNSSGRAAAARQRAATAQARAAARARARRSRVGRTTTATPIASESANGSADGSKKRVKKRRRGGTIIIDNSGDDGYDSYRTRRLRLRGKIRVAKKKVKKKKAIVADAKKVQGSSIEARRPRKVPFDPKKLRKPAQESDTSFDLSIGDYIRYLVIFGLLGAMFLFFAGQFAALRKSWEKGD